VQGRQCGAGAALQGRGLALQRRVLGLPSPYLALSGQVALALVVLVAAEASDCEGGHFRARPQCAGPTGVLDPTCEPPNPQMQPTGRTVPSSARVLIRRWRSAERRVVRPRARGPAADLQVVRRTHFRTSI
jgi:hypothetical protein